MNNAGLVGVVRNLVSGIVVGAALISSPYGTSNECYSAEPARGSRDNSPIRDLGNCLWFTSQKSLEVIGAQGGYGDTKPDVRHDVKSLFIPYYYDRGKFLMPETLSIEKELSNYINNHFFEELRSQGKVRFLSDGSKIETLAKIKKGEVEFRYKLSLRLSQNDFLTTTFTMSPGPMTLKSKLYEMIEIANFVTNSHREDPTMINITALSKMAKERDLKVQSRGFNDLPNCTFYKISKHKKGESHLQSGGLSDKTNEEEKDKEDEFWAPEAFQFFNRYNQSAKGVSPSSQSDIPIAPKADPSE